MAHTCNRCRTSYESGGFYGGHDYCNTCFVRVQEEEKQKKAEERKRELEVRFLQEKRKEELARKEQAERQRWEQEKLRREHEQAEQERRAEALQKIRIAGAKDIGKPKHNWDITISKPPEQQTQTADIVGAGQAKRKLALPPAPKARTEMPGRRQMLVHTEIAQPKRREKPKAIVAVSLAVKDGLPVSLSVGQKGIRTLFTAKNTTAKKLTLEFAVAIEDSKKKQIAPRLEPKQCTLEPGAEAPMRAEFDLPDGMATGPLAFTAQLRENAIYVDREEAKSEPIAMTSQIKTPMELEYLPGGEKFEKQGDGTLLLVLAFENRGESGGFLLPRSTVGYGKENAMKRANLAAKTKIKGMQKKAELRFSPAEKTGMDFLVFDLQGMDANGKEYGLQASVKVRAEGKKEKREAGKAEGKNSGKAQAGAGTGNETAQGKKKNEKEA